MKATFITKTLVLLTGLALIFSSSLYAGGKKGGSSKGPKAAPTPYPTVISAVSPGSVTVTENKTTKTITVTQFTEITVNSQRAGLADLRPGMTVNLTFSSPTQAARIVATGK